MSQLSLMNAAQLNSAKPISNALALPLMSQMGVGMLNPTASFAMQSPMLPTLSPSSSSGFLGKEANLYCSSLMGAPATAAGLGVNSQGLAGSLGTPGGLHTSGGLLTGTPATSTNLPNLLAIADSLQAQHGVGTAVAPSLAANLGGDLPAVAGSLGAIGGLGTSVASSMGASAVAANLGSNLQAAHSSLGTVGLLGTSATSSAVSTGGFMFGQPCQLPQAGMYGAIPTLGAMSMSVRSAPY